MRDMDPNGVSTGAIAPSDMSEPLRVFIGYDPRQSVSSSVLTHSLLATATVPVSVTPLVLSQLPITRQGLTPFTYSRFLVPWLCGYSGTALFLDSDTLVLEDIVKLFALASDTYQVQIVRGTKPFEYASVMLFNCARCTVLTPEFVQTAADMHRLSWCDPGGIGVLPGRWNHLIGYDDPAPAEGLSLLHYTQGVPAWPETKDCEHANLWFRAMGLAMHAEPWADLMGKSVHAVQLEDGTLVPRLLIGEEKLKRLLASR